MPSMRNFSTPSTPFTCWDSCGWLLYPIEIQLIVDQTLEAKELMSETVRIDSIQWWDGMSGRNEVFDYHWNSLIVWLTSVTKRLVSTHKAIHWLYSIMISRLWYQHFLTERWLPLTELWPTASEGLNEWQTFSIWLPIFQFNASLITKC